MRRTHCTQQKTLCVCTLLAVVAALPASSEEGDHAHAHDHDEHEKTENIVITASPLEHDRDDLAASIESLDRTDITTQLGTTIGETLRRTPGVATSGFAAGASRPVIRGQDAFRTGVRENGLGTGDVSTLSPDHGVPVNPLTAERIEVLRGPATLRYGGGSIAGVVNALTNRVPTRQSDELVRGEVFGSAGHNADERDIAALVEGGTGPISWHFDAMSRDSNDYDIPDGGVQTGSSTDARAFSGGAAVIGEVGRLGFAYSRFENEYGIPEAEGGENAFIDLNTNRYRIEGDLYEPVPGIRELRGRMVVTDYEHDELAEGAIGQTYEADEVEARIEAIHADIGPVSGAVGLHIRDRHENFGGEAEQFLAPADTKTIAGYFFEELPLAEHLDLQTGLRIEGTTVEGRAFREIGKREREFVPVSGSVALAFHPGEGLHFGITGSAAQRAPSSVELFARGPHEATETFEIGDPSLDEETAFSGEITARMHRERFRVELASFITRYNDYVFGQLTGATVDEDFMGVPASDPEALDLLVYTARDALFYGGEFDFEVDLFDFCDGTLGLDGQFDWVRARFTSGSDRNVPRITPIRWGGGVLLPQPALARACRFPAHRGFEERQPQRDPHIGLHLRGRRSRLPLGALRGARRPGAVRERSQPGERSGTQPDRHQQGRSDPACGARSRGGARSLLTSRRIEGGIHCSRADPAFLAPPRAPLCCARMSTEARASAPGPRTLVVDGAVMTEPEAVPFANGTAVLFSTASPDKLDDGAGNEDAAAVLPVGAGGGVLAVADGLGGLPGGASAAQRALASLESALRPAAVAELESLRAPILDAFEAANRAVLDLSIGAATTLAVAEVRDGNLRAYHVGDSSIWVVGQRGKLKLHTVAHSPTGYGIEAGLMDESEALHHEERHLVSNALGSSDMRIEIGSAAQLSRRDTVLLASDGLFDNLSADEIVEHVRAGPLEDAACQLILHCNERMTTQPDGDDMPCKPDDLSFILYRQD